MTLFKPVLKNIESQSGKFLVDNEGIALRFEPSKENEFIIEKIEFEKYHYSYQTSKTIRTFIVPEGVTGFVSDFMRHTRVIEKFELPISLLSIGNNSFDIKHGIHSVFANCILPSVIIPKSVKEIGVFAFGHSLIETLQLPVSLRSPYGRQFKDSHIETLVLPSEWKELNIYVDNDNRLRLENNEKGFDFLRWPSTNINKLIFY